MQYPYDFSVIHILENVFLHIIYKYLTAPFFSQGFRCFITPVNHILLSH